MPGEPRAAVLHCHLMDAPAPSLARAAADTPVRAAVRERIMRAVRAGVELWQARHCSPLLVHGDRSSCRGPVGMGMERQHVMRCAYDARLQAQVSGKNMSQRQ